MGRKIINLLYNTKEFEEADGRAIDFVKAFRKKLVYFVDNSQLLMEWAIAAFLDVR